MSTRHVTGTLVRLRGNVWYPENRGAFGIVVSTRPRGTPGDDPRSHIWLRVICTNGLAYDHVTQGAIAFEWLQDGGGDRWT